MIENLRISFKTWYEKYDLIGLYLVGSFSLNEDNPLSDFDTLGISNRKLHVKEILAIRKDLNQISKDKFHIRVGFRVRTIKELDEFQFKAKSWGYDLNESIRIFGIDLNSVIKPTHLVPVEKREVFDNLIEKAWYDLLFINDEKDQTVVNYLSAKAILILMNFVIYYNGNFINKDKSRLEYLRQNKFLLDSIPIDLDLIKTSYEVKNSPLQYDYDLGLNSIRYNLLKGIYLQLFPTFEKLKEEYSTFNYWTYSPKYFKPVNNIIKSISFLKDDEKLSQYNNDAFVWRIILMETFLKLDKASDTIDESRIVENLVDSFFSMNSNFTEENKSYDRFSFLRLMEKIRINSSVIGFDFAKKGSIII